MKNWEKVKFKEIAELNPYKIDKKFQFETIEYLDISSVGSGYIEKPKIMKLSKAPSRAKRLIHDNNIILSTVRPNRRSFYYFRNAKKNLVVSTGFAVIQAKDKILPKFLYYLINDCRFTDYLTRSAKGAAYPAVDEEVIYNATMYIPKEFKEQKKIAAILSAYDELIENNNRRIEILEEMAETIYKEWFVYFRFPGHEEVKMVDSELGKIPGGWEVRSILDSPYFNYINESCPKYEGNKEYLATANIEGINILKRGEWVSYSEKPSRAQKIPQVYSVWFSKMKESYKVLGFTEENQCFSNSCILSSGFDGFRSGKEFFAFLYCVIKSKYFHQKRDQYCTGAVQISLTKKGLESIKIIIPSKNIILKFNEIALPIINQILVSQQKNNCLKNIKDLLLPKLISGTIDVSDLDIKIEELK